MSGKIKSNTSSLISRCLGGLMIFGLSLSATSCFKDEEPISEKYKEWREENEQYVKDAEAKIDENGGRYYTKIVPSWAPDAYSLVHWHNDRSLTANNLSPMDNSTVAITYELFNIKGEKLADSFSNPDSLYTSRPSQNIVGVWAPLTHMNVGDSVTIVIPSQAGYGEANTSTIPPYSTLIYNIKLKAVKAYEVP